MTEVKDLLIDRGAYLKDEIFRLPGIVIPKESQLRSEDRDYYFDIDPLLNNPSDCRALVSWYGDTINNAVRVFGLGGSSLLFIDRVRLGIGGPTGILRIAAALGIRTGMRQFVYPGHPSGHPLASGRLILVSDFCPTGSEELNVIKHQMKKDVEVTDMVTFGLDTNDFQFDEFDKLSVRIHHLIDAPRDLRLEQFD